MVNNLHCNNVIKLLQAIKYCTLNNGAELYCIVFSQLFFNRLQQIHSRGSRNPAN